MKKRISRIGKVVVDEFTLLVTEYLIVFILGVISLIGFFWLADLLLDNEIISFDTYFTDLIFSFSSPGMDAFMQGVTFMGNKEFVIWPTLLVLVYFLFIKPHRWYSIKIPVVALGSISINILLKNMYQRERPVIERLVEASGLSFPSGHAMFSFSFYGLLIYLTYKLIKNKYLKYSLISLLSLVIFFIGISRVYVGVHYPSDVVAGFAGGFLWLVLSIYILRKIELFMKRKEREEVKEKVKEAKV